MKKLLAIIVACLMPIGLIAGSGDVNGDGLVSKADIDAIISYIMKTSPNVSKESADVNDDGDINAADIVELIKMINQPFIVTNCPDNNHPHWIDLGLPSGTQWLCCNKGASTPEEYGDYFKFGQVKSAPSWEQIKELLNNTTSEWTTQNGVNGRSFTGSNGATIFLPASYQVGFNGLYWSSTLYDEDFGFFLFFYSNSVDWSNFGLLDEFKLSVRPVR